MRLLDRYLLRELLVPLGFCLGGFLIFWISFDLFSELKTFQDAKLHGADVVAYYVVKTPEFLVTVLPVALLLALLYTLTNHARHHELTAIRAAGVSLWRMCAPYLAVGFAASLALFALNELWVPDTEAAADKILQRRLGKASDSAAQRQLPGFTNDRQRRTWQFAAYNPRTREMLDPKVEWQLPDGSSRELIAHRGVWSNGVWTFYGVVQNNTYAPSGMLTNQNPQADLAMPGFSETPAVIRSEIKISDRLSRRGVKRADIPLLELLDYLRLHPQPPGKDRAWLYTKLYGRLAAPWTCLVVVLIAVPFGAASGRRNVFVGVASSIVICFGYFVLLQVGLALGAGGYLAPWLAAWLPNLVVGGSGWWLSLRVH